MNHKLIRLNRFVLSFNPHRVTTPSLDYICRRFETGGSLGQRVKCRRVPQPRWVGARRSAKGGGDGRERWKSRGLRVCLAPRLGAFAVGGYKRPRGRGASSLTRAPVPTSSPRGQPPLRGPWSFLL
jgi:hypothetical protein